MDLIGLERLRSRLGKANVIFDLFVDRSGTQGLALLVDDDFVFVVNDGSESFRSFVHGVFTTSKALACFDMRKVLALGEELAMHHPIIDVRLLNDGLRKLSDVVSDESKSVLIGHERKWIAHARAAKTAKIDLTKHSLLRMVPQALIQESMLARARAARELVVGISQAEHDQYVNETYLFARALYRMERNLIHYDREFVSFNLNSKVQLPDPIRRSFTHMKEIGKNGFLKTAFNPVGGKTGRIKVDSGPGIFNCMGIPHGIPRKALTSRFPGGKIVSFDFNAIDYRCIVSSVEDEAFKDYYKDARDFHERTAKFLFIGKIDELKRKVVKQVSYVSIYGGSAETIASKTGLSVGKAKEILERLGDKMLPISRLKDELWEQASKNGVVLLPNGREVPIEPGSHAGKVMGLYAQSYSSWVFEKAIVAVDRLVESWKSKLLFTVHDELVVDMHPSELTRDVEIMSCMEWATGSHDFVVNMKIGDSYGSEAN